MAEKGKKMWAVLLAFILVLSMGLTACKPPVSNVESDEWAVTLDYNDEEVVEDKVVKPASRPRTYYVSKGEDMKQPAVPLRSGYQLANWTKEKTGGDVVSFPFKPEADTTLYAQWEAQSYKTYFDYNFEGAPEAFVSNARHGDAVADPFGSNIVPTLTAGAKEGEYVHSGNAGYFTLGEWMTQPEPSAPVKFPYTVTQDELRFYLRWYVNGTEFYNVTFDANYPDDSENDVTDSIRAISGETKFSAADMPEVSFLGWEFKGWATTPDAKKGVSYPWQPTGDTKLYAIWEHTEFTIRFYYNYPGAPSSGLYKTIKHYSGETITADDVPDPTRVFGDYTYKFEGWLDSSYAMIGQPVELPYTVSKSVRLYAKWSSPKTVTDTFDAEFSVFNPQDTFLGYSGSAQGKGAIASDIPAAHSEPYPLFGGNLPDQNTHTGHHVSYLFTPGATLRFYVYSDKAVSGVTLSACLSTEFVQSLTISPDNENAYQFKVNGESLSYTPITVNGGPNAASDLYKGSQFKEYTVSTSVSLKEGMNEILLVTANNNSAFGGTTQATAPTVDYIKLKASGAELSWYPVYDNLWKFE